MKEYIVNLADISEYGRRMIIGNGIPKEELIRCKDCKYYRIYKHTDWTVELCGRIRTTMADPVKEDDYCSKAERRTDETD